MTRSCAAVQKSLLRQTHNAQINFRNPLIFLSKCQIFIYVLITTFHVSHSHHLVVITHIHKCSSMTVDRVISCATIFILFWSVFHFRLWFSVPLLWHLSLPLPPFSLGLQCTQPTLQSERRGSKVSHLGEHTPPSFKFGQHNNCIQVCPSAQLTIM